MIEESWRSERLFFTFNHPTSKLLIAIASRLLGAAGLAIVHIPNLKATGEPLARIVPPMLPSVARSLSLTFPWSTSAHGIALNFSTHAFSRSNVRRPINLTSLSKRHFVVTYDLQADDLEDCKLS